ncbi:MFS transporter [Halarcobacter ebronensis]|uniref:Major facilitator superfamily (MFS) profile domain-containing protein n=1 Tax=Halarcobacter ebronensis TaxID=1462615 RepID=A0A4Q1ARK7_9BACT|nr:MFS transporter [Halarcobacter ebronensis]QKF83454.1 major facilitator superfamily transporter [Halarcobacter ebronensis]RXK08254.1 hypothetical protein CRV07_00140 [Halarcobacter ebronensis]
MREYSKVIISSFLVILACLGLGRFAFGMILPNMQESLALSTTQVGFIGTANFIGYFAGIFFANHLYTKYSTYKLVFITLVLQAVSMALMVVFNNYLIISFLYTFSGFFSAIANIAIMAHMANVIPKNIRGKALGIVVGGNGLAIIISGQITPFVEQFVDNAPWRTAWLIFSIVLIFIAFFSQPGIKKHTKHELPEIKVSSKKYFFIPSFWKISSLYMIFGFTNSIYVTYAVKTVITQYHITSSLSGDFWALLGFTSIFSGFLFGIVADKFGAYKALIFVFILQTLAHFTLTINVDSYIIWFSAVMLGISVWCIPSLIILLTSIHFDVKRAAQIISLVTILFALCQAFGPVVAGYLHDITGSFSLIFLLTSLMALTATILSIIFSRQKIKQIH